MNKVELDRIITGAFRGRVPFDDREVELYNTWREYKSALVDLAIFGPYLITFLDAKVKEVETAYHEDLVWISLAMQHLSADEVIELLAGYFEKNPLELSTNVELPDLVA